MPRKPRLTISVIVSTYRRPEVLRRCLRGLVGQRRLPEEIVVVRKESDPESGAAMEEFRHLYGGPVSLRHVVVVERSILAAENAGIAATEGDIACFIDDDAVPQPDWLERLEAHYQDPAIAGVGGRDVVHNAQGVLGGAARTVGKLYWFGRLVGNHHRELPAARAVDFLKGCNMSYRRQLLPKIDEHLAGEFTYGYEIDIGLSLRRRGYRLMYDPAIRVDHYPSRPQALEDHDPEVAYLLNHNQAYLLLKHCPLGQKVLSLLYLFLVGDKTTIGLARLPLLLLPPNPRPLSVLSAHFRGKVAGVRTYLRRLQEARG